MSIVVKVVCKGEFRRSRIPSLSLEELEETVLETFPELARGSFDIHYRDDEGDSCLLSRATFPDFAYFNERATMVKLEVVAKKPEQPAPGPGGCSSQPPAGQPAAANQPCGGPPWSGRSSWPPSADQPCGGPPWCWDAGHMEGLMSRLLCEGGAFLGPLLSHVLPSLVQQLAAGNHDKLEQLALETARGVLQSVRSALEHFPLFQPTCAALDEALASEKLDGLGAAVEAALHAFEQLAPPVQQEVVSAVILSVTQGPRMEHCGQGVSGWGKRHGEYHGKHHGKHHGRHHGNHHGKGNGKCHGRRCKSFGSHSSSSSSSSSSSGSAGAKWRCAHQELKKWKQQHKAAKKAWKAEWRAQKEKFKAEKQALKQGRRHETEEGKDFKLPVQLTDGRDLSVSWNRGEVAAEVAARFATQHNIGSDDVPMITNFIEQIQTTAPAQPVHVQPVHEQPMDVGKASDSGQQPAAPPMDVGEPTYDSQLAELEVMGFMNRELNQMLLAKHRGSLQKVVDTLL